MDGWIWFSTSSHCLTRSPVPSESTQCLIGEDLRTLRDWTSLSLARHLLEHLQDQGWLLDPSEGSETTELTTLPRPSVEEALAAYAGFIAWVPSKKAFTSSPDALWLQPLLAELCSCLAASPDIGARWALRMPEGDAGSSLVFTACVCAMQRQHLPAADLLRAYLRNVSREVRGSVLAVALSSAYPSPCSGSGLGLRPEDLACSQIRVNNATPISLQVPHDLASSTLETVSSLEVWDLGKRKCGVWVRGSCHGG